MLSVPSARQLPSGGQAELIDSATAKQQMALKQLSAEVTRQQMAARQLMEVKPREALDVLKQAKLTVEESTVDPGFRATLSKRLDVTFAEVEKYMEKNRAQLELDERNQEALNDVRRRRTGKVEVDERIAKLVDEFNKLMDEQRFPEAEILAKRANELIAGRTRSFNSSCGCQNLPGRRLTTRRFRKPDRAVRWRNGPRSTNRLFPLTTASRFAFPMPKLG